MQVNMSRWYVAELIKQNEEAREYIDFGYTAADEGVPKVPSIHHPDLMRYVCTPYALRNMRMATSTTLTVCMIHTHVVLACMFDCVLCGHHVRTSCNLQCTQGQQSHPDRMYDTHLCCSCMHVRLFAVWTSCAHIMQPTVYAGPAEPP